MKFIKIVCALIALSVFLCSCSDKTVDSELVNEVMSAAEKTNDIKKYSASFILEVTDEVNGNIVLFAQGSFDADKTGPLKMSGSMVQTVNASPASLYMAYSDGKYYAKSGEISTFTEIDESVFIKQFLCSDAVVARELDTVSKRNNGSGGNIYYFTSSAASLGDKLLPLVDAEVFYYAGMKKMRTETLETNGFSGEYVVDEKTGLLLSRKITYSESAYDTAPYYPNETVSDESMKHTLSVSLKVTYKKLDGSTDVILPDFASQR